MDTGETAIPVPVVDAVALPVAVAPALTVELPRLAPEEPEPMTELAELVAEAPALVVDPEALNPVPLVLDVPAPLPIELAPETVDEPLAAGIVDVPLTPATDVEVP